MEIASNDMLKKIAGDVAIEVPEAGYRLAAAQLARSVKVAILNHAKTAHEGTPICSAAKFLETEIGEAVLGLALAAALELVPTQTLQEERGHLAHNLRVGAYAELGETLLCFAGFIDAEVMRVTGHLCRPKHETSVSKDCAVGGRAHERE